MVIGFSRRIWLKSFAALMFGVSGAVSFAADIDNKAAASTYQPLTTAGVPDLASDTSLRRVARSVFGSESAILDLLYELRSLRELVLVSGLPDRGTAVGGNAVGLDGGHRVGRSVAFLEEDRVMIFSLLAPPTALGSIVLVGDRRVPVKVTDRRDHCFAARLPASFAGSIGELLGADAFLSVR